MVKYKLLDKQREFIEIPHSNSLDVAIYQGGYGSGKTWCGSLLGILLAKNIQAAAVLSEQKSMNWSGKRLWFLISTI